MRNFKLTVVSIALMIATTFGMGSAYASDGGDHLTYAQRTYNQGKVDILRVTQRFDLYISHTKSSARQDSLVRIKNVIVNRFARLMGCGIACKETIKGTAEFHLKVARDKETKRVAGLLTDANPVITDVADSDSQFAFQSTEGNVAGQLAMSTDMGNYRTGIVLNYSDSGEAFYSVHPYITLNHTDSTSTRLMLNAGRSNDVVVGSVGAQFKFNW